VLRKYEIKNHRLATAAALGFLMQTTLTKTGKVTIVAGTILIEGFDAKDATDTDVKALAIVWAIGWLERELLATLHPPK
jgi:hypothetical protein